MWSLQDGCAGHYAILVTVAAALTLPNLGAPSLWDIDEGHNAEAAREMFVAGDWLVPTFNYRLRTDKPVLLYWCQIAAYHVFGVNEFAARLPSALAGLAAILITYELGRCLFSPTTGLLAGLTLAGTVQFCAAAHFANPDTLLLAFTTLTLLAFWKGFSQGRLWWSVPSGASAGLAALAKGPVGLLLPTAVALIFLAWSRRLRFLLNPRILLGCLTFGLVAIPWYAAVGAETKGVFLQEFFLTHNAGRFRGAMEGHGGPWFYYLVSLTIGFAPWSIFLGLAVFYALGQRARSDCDGLCSDDTPATSAGPMADGYRFLWSWIGTYLLFFSLSATKLPNYVLPAFPGVAILTGRYLDRWRRGTIAPPGGWHHVSLGCLAVVGVAAAGGMLVAGGVFELAPLRGRKWPGVQTWAVAGAVPIAGALLGTWLLGRQRRTGLIVTVAAAACSFVALLAAGTTPAVDAQKAVRPLAHLLPSDHTEREVRVGCFGFWRPSLVFYGRREAERLETEAAAQEFMRYPIEVYLFTTAAAWDNLQPHLAGSYREVGRHADLYQADEIVLVANR
jgi:4-amino-4-deoxy-L-arabinose transferase-like glycosyltransferase